jgi:hypothetical protein
LVQVRWRDFLFKLYRHHYGEYQARQLLSLQAKDRRARVKFLERHLTRETDTSQPLWPEISDAQQRMLEHRERAVNVITRNCRYRFQLEHLQKEPASPEIEEAIARIRSLLDESSTAVEAVKLKCKAAECELRELVERNRALAGLKKEPT